MNVLWDTYKWKLDPFIFGHKALSNFLSHKMGSWLFSPDFFHFASIRPILSHFMSIMSFLAQRLSFHHSPVRSGYLNVQHMLPYPLQSQFLPVSARVRPSITDVNVWVALGAEFYLLQIWSLKAIKQACSKWIYHLYSFIFLGKWEPKLLIAAGSDMIKVEYQALD